MRHVRGIPLPEEFVRLTIAGQYQFPLYDASGYVRAAWMEVWYDPGDAEFSREGLVGPALKRGKAIALTYYLDGHAVVAQAGAEEGEVVERELGSPLA